MISKEKQLTEEPEQKHVVALDVGTTKICAVIGKYDDEGNIQILGAGTVQSEGLKKGVITDIGASVRAIKKAVGICEQKSGFEISDIYVGIAGQHIEGINTDGVVAVKGELITEADIERVVDAAKAHKKGDKEIIHILPQDYIVDEQDGIKNPVGMAGKRLKSTIHIVFASTTAIANLQQSCRDSGLQIERIVIEPLASSYAVLSKDEKDLGVVLIDIGGGTTDLVIYKNNNVLETAVIPIGGNHITGDISVGLRTPREEAKHIKHTEGTAIKRNIKDGETIRVSGIQNRPERICDKKILGVIIEARVREIFNHVNDIIKRGGYESILGAGVVLTGGCSLLNNIDLLADEVIKLPSRVATPLNISGLSEMVSSPIYSTAVGLVKYGLDEQTELNEIKIDHTAKKLRDGFFNFNSFFKKYF